MQEDTTRLQEDTTRLQEDTTRLKTLVFAATDIFIETTIHLSQVVFAADGPGKMTPVKSTLRQELEQVQKEVRDLQQAMESTIKKVHDIWQIVTRAAE